MDDNTKTEKNKDKNKNTDKSKDPAATLKQVRNWALSIFS